MNTLPTTLAGILAVAFPATHVSAADTLEAIELRCEYFVNPLGIDETRPRLGWQLESATRGQKQSESDTEYKIGFQEH